MCAGKRLRTWARARGFLAKTVTALSSFGKGDELAELLECHLPRNGKKGSNSAEKEREGHVVEI